MPDTPYIVDVTPQTFPRTVCENSHKGQVFVYFWSPRAGPCNRLLPRLVKLADEAAGRFLLTLLNTDEHGRFARDLGIHSIPTVSIYTKGEVVETIHGAWSETEFRRIVDKYVSARRSAIHAAALEASLAGDDEAALQILGASETRSRDLRARIDLLKLMLKTSRYDEALAEIAALRRTGPRSGEMLDLLTHFELVCTAASAPPLESLLATRPTPTDSPESLYRIAAIQIVNDDFSGARTTLERLAAEADGEAAQKARRALDAITRIEGQPIDTVNYADV